jgi:DNA-binding LytR/AlgR family response regulator
MTPTALIAEDEPLLAAALKADLAAVWPELQVVAECGDGDSALAEALRLQPSLCFLDIRMPGLGGLDVAQAVTEDWPEGANAPPLPLLVFVTAYDQYAIAAFERQAADYLLKPVPRERLALAVQRLQQRLAARNAIRPGVGDASTLDASLAPLRELLASLGPQSGVAAPAAPASRIAVIPAQLGNVTQMIPVEEVLYFEAADKYLRVVTASGEHLIRVSLRELLPQLDPAQFWQVHRSLLVQVRAIREARREETGKVVLSLRGRGEKLVASRLYAHLFKGW